MNYQLTKAEKKKQVTATWFPCKTQPNIFVNSEVHMKSTPVFFELLYFKIKFFLTLRINKVKAIYVRFRQRCTLS